MMEQEIEAMDLHLIRNKDKVQHALESGDVEDVELSELWLEAAESWQAALWALYSLMQERGAL